jgi:hypothetical protein
LAEKFNSVLAGNPQVLGSSVSLFTFAEPGWFHMGYKDDKKQYREFR